MNSQNQSTGTYDLEERTFRFAADVRLFAGMIQKTFENVEDLKQLLRSSGSVGANYIEANDGLSAKDFRMRIRICKKEAKESAYWLKLLKCTNEDSENTRKKLFQEANELKLIFAAILRKCIDPTSPPSAFV